MKPARKIQKGIVAVLVVAFLLVDLFPRQGTPDFRYTGCNPDREALNLGYSLASFINDKAISPPIVVSPLAQVLVPLHILVVWIVVAGPSVLKWCNKTLQVTALKRRT